MPEIVHLCEFATLNGGERSMLATFGGVRAAGFTSVVMAPGCGPLAEDLAAKGVELLPFEFHTSDGVRWPQGRLRQDLATILAKRRPAILHANSLAMGRLSGPVALDLKLPSLAHLRDIVRLSSQAIADVNCHGRLLAVSQATRDYHVARGLSAERVHVVYNGVDIERFQPRPPSGSLHRELGLPDDALIIGAVGQIGLRKGQDTLLQAAIRIADRWPNVHYAFVGQRHSEKEESRRFEQELHAVAEGPLAGRVHFLGVRADIDQLMNEWTLLAHTARQEPLGRVLLEAAASGLAVVATDVGGTREIFPPDAEAARLVLSSDVGMLADALDAVLSDPSLRRRLGNAARRRAVEQFSIERSLQNLLPHYRAMLA